MEQLRQAFGWDDFPQPLFYESRFALRFDLGGDHEMGITRFMQAMDRVRAVASLLFMGSENLTVAIRYYGQRAIRPAPANIRRALASVGFAGTIVSLRRMAPRDEDEAEAAPRGYKRFLCVLEVPNRSDQILPFIWASIANEMPIGPRIYSLAGAYIMDMKRGLILYPYDDRGMDVTATSPGLLRPCYEQFNDWLLDYDRARMQRTFGAGVSTVE